MNSIQHRSYKSPKINAVNLQIADSQHGLQFKSSRSFYMNKSLIYSRYKR